MCKGWRKISSPPSSQDSNKEKEPAETFVAKFEGMHIEAIVQWWRFSSCSGVRTWPARITDPKTVHLGASDASHCSRGAAPRTIRPKKTHCRDGPIKKNGKFSCQVQGKPPPPQKGTWLCRSKNAQCCTL